MEKKQLKALQDARTTLLQRFCDAPATNLQRTCNARPPGLSVHGGELACPHADVNATDSDGWTRPFYAVAQD